MLFNSVQFLIFFPVVLIVCCICPLKMRHLWLLAASYYFYMQWNPGYVLLLFSCTCVTYLAGRELERLKQTGAENRRKRQTGCLAAALVLLLGMLGFYKYFCFGLDCANVLLSVLRLGPVTWRPSILLPVGISFYTLQALGYLIDVYRDDVHAEKNFFRYALFVSFFPQLVAGPIERSGNLLSQLRHPQALSYENFRKGLLLILYGLFCKMVIADRAAILVDAVYGDWESCSGFVLVFATILFSFQIYGDFYGYSTIARGTALTMGIRLTDNFKAPYFSRSIREFWRRWHISLSDWLRDYLYIPLGGSRRGACRRNRNLLVVFAVSGLWHGASFAYVVWGLLHGLYQVMGDAVHAAAGMAAGRVRELRIRYLGKEETAGRNGVKALSVGVRQGLVTFLLVSFAWVFFRMGNLPDSVGVIKQMMVWDFGALWDGSLYGFGITKEYLHALLIFIGILLCVDYHKYRGTDVADVLLGQEWWLRVVLFAGLILVILMFGCYGVVYDTQQFIYFQF